MNRPSGPDSANRSHAEVPPLGPAVSSPAKREGEMPVSAAQLLPPFVPLPRATPGPATRMEEETAVPAPPELDADRAPDGAGAGFRPDAEVLDPRSASGAGIGGGLFGFPPSPTDEADGRELVEHSVLDVGEDLILDAEFEVPAWLEPAEPGGEPQGDCAPQNVAESLAPAAAAQPEAPVAEQGSDFQRAQPVGSLADGAAGPAGIAAGAMDEVATRLEQIAARLRTRPAGEWLAGGGEPAASDPLELLITGFALGYAQGARQRTDSFGE